LPISGSDGGVTTSVLESDTLNGVVVDPADVTITDPVPGDYTDEDGNPVTGLTLDPDTGFITVDPGTPAGTYTVSYDLNPDNCSTVEETVVVEPPEILALPETFDPISGADGGVTTSVLESDTLNGVIVDPADVTITDPVPGDYLDEDGNPATGLTLDPDTGLITVDPGTPAGIYTVTYEICENLNPDNCSTVEERVIVASTEITANPEIFEPINGDDGGVTTSVLDSDTLNEEFLDPADVTITDPVPGDYTDEDGNPVTGLTLDPDTGLITIDPGTPPGTYEVSYEICENLNPDNCSTSVETVTVGTIVAEPETFPTIDGDTGGLTPSVLTSDTLNGEPITDPDDVILTFVDSTGGLTLDPDTNGIIIPEGTPEGTYTLTYQICDADNPTICSTVTETVIVGTISATPEEFPLTEAGETTSVSVLDSDTLNGEPVSLDTVSLELISSDPELTLNPDGTISVATGTPAGTYELTYEICDLENPDICSQVTETVTVPAAPAISSIKTQELVDNGDGVDGTGDRLDYTITVTNDGNIELSDVSPVDTLTNGEGTVLTLDSGPTFVSSSAGSPEGTLAIGETATYEAAYTLTADDVNSGLTANTVEVTGTPVLPTDFTGPTPDDPIDISDEGDPSNGDDDPTVFTLLPDAFVDGLSVTKVAGVSTVLRGGTVPYTIVITNNNPAVAVAGVTVDTLPEGFVYVDGSAAIDGVPTDTVDVVGRVVSFPTLIVPSGGSVSITLTARVLTGAPAGDAVNQAVLLDATDGDPLAPVATATVRIEIEPVFDCGDVIGKVFDDQNGNGYQDQGEPGLPAVRIAGVDGTIITTDEFGRYHVPCAVLPDSRGTNFILKVDERSLPTGYRITTENPRVIRLTRGKMKELNFGASISRIVRVDINSRVFGLNDAGEMELVPAFRSGMETLLARVKEEPSTVRVAFHLPDNPTDAQVRTARRMIRDVERYIQRRWRRIGDYKLNIETTFVRRN